MNDTLTPPLDVRLMNMTAAVLFVAVAVAGVASGLRWVLEHPVFAVGGITVRGDVTHNNAATLRANVAPRLRGNFFTLDLAAARAAFEAVPWVRSAVVQREFPNRLRVLLEEHEPVAYWGDEDEGRLVNSYGEVFEANVGDVETLALPRLDGPSGQSALVLQMYRTVGPSFAVLDLAVEQLELSARGGWRIQLANGAEIELGRGTPDEVAVRVRRFVRTLTQVAAQQGRRPDALESADLRYGDGYALRLRGVSTVAAQAALGPR